MNEKTIYRLAIVLSAILHGLAFVLVGFVFPFSSNLQPKVSEAKEYRPPLVFTLAETPESARREKPPEQATHLSDKNAVAQNPAAPQNLPVGEPFATGSLPEATTGPQPPAPLKEPESSPPPIAANEQNAEITAKRFQQTDGVRSGFTRDFLTGGQRSAPQQYSDNSEPILENLQSRAPELGGFSFNTYAWDFAPYMLWLKRHIQRNIYPPPAFTHMGIISGRTLLRFRINQDGTLQGMELLGYNGHKSLMETSVRAVQLSTPFRPLPKDFPEDYLEVTAQFDYIIKR
ncbi:MAG: hypothetical protein ONB44_14220 [candidate division KSB1 bacterium]|nr:hypothetical protein [candidate division KSB1 bacterium]MDZ7303281.1 hypothetical protein [candidate division KSB1 bacterium]